LGGMTLAPGRGGEGRVLASLAKKKIRSKRRGDGAACAPVSMGEETMGVRMLILRVSLVVRSTCAFSGRFVVRHGAQAKVGASVSKKCGGARRGRRRGGGLVPALTSVAGKLMKPGWKMTSS